jgi:hypothetical protein
MKIIKMFKIQPAQAGRITVAALGSAIDPPTVSTFRMRCGGNGPSKDYQAKPIRATALAGNEPGEGALDHEGTRLSAFAVALLVLDLFTASAQINPGIVDPTNSYAGKTYNQLAAGWWQYFMSLPITNSPLYYIPGNPPVPMSTGQSGPVWFMGGNYSTGGTLSYTNTIPSVGLFLIISAIEKDNAGCPPTIYNEPFLRTWAGQTEYQASGMTCTIDDVPVSEIDNVSTTPYRVQSPLFSYTCPALENWLYDRRYSSCYCYSNNSGMLYTIEGAMVDGVFLMISPLSIGSHVIHVTTQYSFGYSADFTYYLTVQPASLNIAQEQNQQFLLSWPQTPDAYVLESSASLSPSSWKAVTNLSLNLTDGIYRATGPIAVTNQFFRIRPN